MQVSPGKILCANSGAGSDGPADGGSGGGWHDENARPPASPSRSAAASYLPPAAHLPDGGPREVPPREDGPATSSAVCSPGRL